MEVGSLLKVMELGYYLAGDIDSVKGFKLGRDVVRLPFQIDSLPGLVKNRVGG